MQGRGIVAVKRNTESCWLMGNSGREAVNSPRSSRLKAYGKVEPNVRVQAFGYCVVDLDGIPPL